MVRYRQAGPPVAERALRQAFAQFPSGVTAIAALVDSAALGIAVSSFTSVSLEPPLASICVMENSWTWARLRTADRIGVSVLGAEHAELARRLGRATANRFTPAEWRLTDRGAIRVVGAPAWLECSLEQEIPAGDHVLALLRVEHVETRAGVRPLVYHASGFHHLAR
ncbi:flavin reductase family protein [Goodfellowiella coeruleoviolacea]|uniref:NADH-FMN oxidoreductase RutF, flavin reductase (DIM6/NTAB) family n=1 Tax=Goodfellowiella coeruleoviolacea TaxID=334858 RepID=A0AAE3GI49_9PSEU|nr:flavin reductase family protein [Goodfellowiella coeruleoviolacea]MCP2168611.1 NADH-FMN oxidoreductase RutF, flavin reductase (DIM6/NTAB) family [Goodfellowiella coeruleoviolacea]